jgi:adenylate cyclase
MTTDVIYTATVQCAAPLSAVWTLCTDTDRLNWASGMKQLKLAPLDNDSAARFLVHTRLGGFKVTYEEEPYEWVHHESMQVTRRMHNGPVSRLRMEFFFKAIPFKGTQVTLRASTTPRFTLLRPLIFLSTYMSVQNLVRQVRRLDTAFTTGQALLPPPRKPAILEDTFAPMLDDLAKREAPDRVHRLATYLRHANIYEVGRLRPYELADVWKLDRQAVLQLFLNATLAGILEIRWELVCPSCRTAAAVVPTLADLQKHATCQVCEIKLSTNIDEAIEVVFTPSSKTRPAELGTYCIGGPARAPHVLSQTILPGNGMGVLKGPATPGSYHLFVRGGASTTVRVDSAGKPSIQLRADRLSNTTVAEVGPEGAINIHNPQPRAVHAKLERFDWANRATPARDVLALPLYQENFAAPIATREFG